MTGRTLLISAVLIAFATGVASADPYADFIPAGGYVEGAGVGSDYLTGDPFSDPLAALGAPTVDTTGFVPSFGDPANVNPVNAAWRPWEIVSVGLGGYLTVGFDDPVVNDPNNPYGMDFIVFGNSFVTVLEDAAGNPQYWNTDDDPADRFMTDSFLAEPGIVSVSQNGTDWYEFDSVFADDWAPTLGRVYDPDSPDPTLGAWNEWWGGPTDPTLPLDPSITLDWAEGLSVADVCLAYGMSAGGTAFDLDWLGVAGLDWISYIRVFNPDGSGYTTEIDAFADVSPLGGPAPIPEPATFALLIAGGIGAVARRRRR